MEEDLPIYPPIYHYSKFSSDRDFILKRMRAIPKDKQQEIADKYGTIFRLGNKESRRKANEFLHSVAVHYRDNRKG